MLHVSTTVVLGVTFWVCVMFESRTTVNRAIIRNRLPDVPQRFRDTSKAPQSVTVICQVARALFPISPPDEQHRRYRSKLVERLR